MQHERSCDRIDKSSIDGVLSLIPDYDSIMRISNIFHALRSEPRLKMMYLLLEKDMCVCELEYALKMSQSAISHNLRTLRQLDLVRVKKDGKFAIYSVADEHVKALLELSQSHVMGCV